MSIPFSHYDKRNYPTLSVSEGYDEWATAHPSWTKHVGLPISFALALAKDAE